MCKYGVLRPIIKVIELFDVISNWTKSLKYLTFLELGNLDQTNLISEIKKIYDEGYQLGLEEAKEMTRGKFLNIFSRKK